jgi:uncharacterized DUF497 family protein
LGAESIDSAPCIETKTERDERDQGPYSAASLLDGPLAGALPLDTSGPDTLLGRDLAGMYNCTYHGLVPDWDAEKAAVNLRKHGVDFADAATALSDERALTVPDPSAVAEERFVSMGMDALGRILVMVYTWREDDVRLISARKATASERREYGRKR